MVWIDMSEYGEKVSMLRLMGVVLGLLGYGDGG